MFPEKNPKESPVPLTHYQRPGLKPLAVPRAPGPGRNIWAASNGDGYAVIGAGVYYVGPDWSLTLVGQVTAGLNTPCSLIDNGIEVMVADGSENGWRFDLATHAAGTWTPLSDPSWTGALRLDYIDTFIIWGIPGTKNFRSTLSNQIEPMDPTYIAAKTAWPDPLQAMIVNRHEMLLIGRVKSERWFNAGDPAFPFEQLPGTYTEHGTVAPYSVCSADVAVYWVGLDLQGQGVVFRQRGYECERISNHALEVAIRKMYDAGSIADAIAWTYQQDGHVFLALQFPSGDQSWYYDEAVGDPETAWHQRAWCDPSSGQLHRERNNGYASLYGKQVTIDWQNGTIYALDLNTYTDTVNAGLGPVQGPVQFIRTFPHLMSGKDPASGQVVLANGKEVRHERFLLDIEVGRLPAGFDGGSQIGKPLVSLRWSDTRGASWGQEVLQTTGVEGAYETRPEWTGLGNAMDRVYEVAYSYAGAAALNGAWVEGTVKAR